MNAKRLKELLKYLSNELSYVYCALSQLKYISYENLMYAIVEKIFDVGVAYNYSLLYQTQVMREVWKYKY